MMDHPRLAVIAMIALGTILLPDAPLHFCESSCEGERARIQAHLQRVERELRSGDVSHLSASQRAARARNLSALRDYRQGGVFPHNHDFSNRRMPYFIDRHGTRCAMAHLIESSGAGDLVRRVAASSNNARIRELAGDPQLLAWLEREGLTVEEAARIQPGYDMEDWPTIRSDEGNLAYKAATVGACGLSAIAIAMNMTSYGHPLEDRQDRSEFAAAMGAVGLGLGIPALAVSDKPPTRALGAINTAVGAMSLFTGIMTFRSSEEPSTTADAQVNPSPVTWAAAPLIGLGPERANGAVFHLRF
jgi:hypothetical protein